MISKICRNCYPKPLDWHSGLTLSNNSIKFMMFGRCVWTCVGNEPQTNSFADYLAKSIRSTQWLDLFWHKQVILAGGWMWKRWLFAQEVHLPLPVGIGKSKVKLSIFILVVSRPRASERGESRNRKCWEWRLCYIRWGSTCVLVLCYTTP
jgi:hypothetical protein